jgi:hypothetical protein
MKCASAAVLHGSRLEVLDPGHVVFSSEPEAFLSHVEPFTELALLGAPR